MEKSGSGRTTDNLRSASVRARGKRSSGNTLFQFPQTGITVRRMSVSSSSPRYKGVFPVVPTTFTDTGDLDLESQKRCVDFMIDAGSHGLCILANFSEQFVLSDHEREILTTTILRHVSQRVPV